MTDSLPEPDLSWSPLHYAGERDRAGNLRAEFQTFAFDRLMKAIHGPSRSYLNEALVLGLVLDHADRNDLELPTTKTADLVPHLGISWRRLSNNLWADTGLSLSDLKMRYGLTYANCAPDREAIKQATETWKASGIFTPSGDVKTKFSEEAALRAIIMYAADHDFDLPTIASQDPVPGFPDEKWITFNHSAQIGANGFEDKLSLFSIKQQYSLMAGGKPDQNAIRAAVGAFLRDGTLPAERNKDLYTLSPESVLTAMLLYAADHDFDLPTQKTRDAVPGYPGQQWVGIDGAGKQGIRGMKLGDTLPVIKQRYGLMSGQKVDRAAVRRAVDDFHSRGALPEPVMNSRYALTPEIILTAMLKHAALNPRDDSYDLPTQHTKDPVPGHAGESWAALNSAGMAGHRGLPKGASLSGIKEMYGLCSGRTKHHGAIKLAVENWIAAQALPDRKAALPPSAQCPAP